MYRRIRSYFGSYWPAYANGTLGPLARFVCVVLLRLDPAARREMESVARVRLGVASRPERSLPPGLLTEIQRQTQSAPRLARVAAGRSREIKLAWAVAFVLVFVALITLWYALPPAVQLEWSVAGQEPVEFRLYRARLVGEDEAPAHFELLSSMPAGDQGPLYSYSDIRTVPGQQYLYRVDALDTSGRIVQSNATLADSISVLPGLFGTIAAILVLIYGLFVLVVRKRDRIGLDGVGTRLVV